MSDQGQLTDEIHDICERAQVDVRVHARSLDGTREWGLEPNSICVTASTYKVAVLLELACQYDEGRLSPTQRVRVSHDTRSVGPTGISSMVDDVELSLRDLALLMMQVSDNTATDVVQELVGTERISVRLAGLGLADTTIRLDCAGLVAEAIADLGGTLSPSEAEGIKNPANPFGLAPQAYRAAVAASKSINGLSGNTTTPRDMTTLLSLIWRDEAGSPEACAEVRRIMAQQYAPHRLSTAYNDGPSIAGKTGTFWGGIANEVGVIDFGGSEAYAIAVFLRNRDFGMRNGRGNHAIGQVARVVIDQLRLAGGAS